MEEKYLKNLRDHTKETLHLLSGHEMKPERERSVCAERSSNALEFHLQRRVS